jgi:hypothetical protein
MNMSEEERRQFVRAMVEILDNHAADLTAAGFDPANKKAELTALAEDADDKEAGQVSARAALATATTASQEATTNGYKAASNTVDLVVGLLGKDHALSKIIRKLRSE